MKRILLCVLCIMLSGCWTVVMSWQQPQYYVNGNPIPEGTVLECQLEYKYIDFKDPRTNEDLLGIVRIPCEKAEYKNFGIDYIDYVVRIRAREVYAHNLIYENWGPWSDPVSVPAPREEQ